MPGWRQPKGQRVTDFILSNEPAIRLGFFAGIFLVMALWEFLAPRRKRSHSRLARWPSNLAVSFLNTALLRLLIPTAAVGLALIGEERGWGLFNQVAVPFWLAFILAVLILDFVIYLQHVMFHAVPLFWRFHRMHHTDLDIDVTTGARFHPVEILLSMGLKLATVAALGPPAVAVVVFEVLLNATSMFNHSNVKLPLGLDRILRLLLVTPDMHRVHHSVIPNETNSNFGFNSPWWDRLFGTYLAQPQMGHDGMEIGIAEFREPRELWLDRMILQPFRSRTTEYPLHRG